MDNKKMRVWWIPQVGVDATFRVPVHSVEEAKKIMDVLGFYDCLLMNNDLRGDYCNCGGLEIWDEEVNDWTDWYYDDAENYYDDVDEYCEEMSPDSAMLAEDEMAMAEQVHFD